MTTPQQEPTPQQEQNRQTRYLSHTVRDFAKNALENLPIYAHLDAITAALKSSPMHALVLTAETAAGKSTAVPFALLDAFGGTTLMLEPRRLAALSIATRCADIAHDDVGNLCGYRMHLDSRVSPSTRFCVLTEAVLVRMMQTNPSLDGVSVVVLDEFHERSIHSDLALAFLKELLLLRDDLYVLVMSATIDTQKLCAFLGCPIYHVSGRRFDVAVEYMNVSVEETIRRAVHNLSAQNEGMKGTPHAADSRTDKADTAPVYTDSHTYSCTDTHPSAQIPEPDSTKYGGKAAPVSQANTILVFLPGIADIRRTEKNIAHLRADGIDVRILHSSVPFAEQKKVLSPNESPKPRVILSSSVAETSLTVPGVRIVIDSGLARVNRFDAQTGMNRLVTETESEFSAVQRAGRAGRTANGTCYRLWAQNDARISDFAGEIMRSDLTALVLECARWGARGIDGIEWLDKPPEGAWAASVSYLTHAECLQNGAITQKGKDVLSLGVHPRLALVALLGTAEALEYAVTYSGEQTESGKEKLKRDLQKRLSRLQKRPLGAQDTKPSPDTHDCYIEERSEKVHGESTKKAHGTDKHTKATHNSSATSNHAADANKAAQIARDTDESKPETLTGSAVLLAGFFDRLACNEDGVYRFPSGRKAALAKSGTGSTEPHSATNGALLPKWIVALRADAGEREGRIYEWVPIDVPDAWLKARCTQECDVFFTDGTGGNGSSGKGDTRKVRRTEKRMYGKIVLSERAVPPQPDDVKRAYATLIRTKGLESLPWSKDARAFYRRALFWYAHGGYGKNGGFDGADGTFNTASDALTPQESERMLELALVTDLENWFIPFVPTNGALTETLFLDALRYKLDGSAVDRAVPTRLTLENGRTVRVSYENAGGNGELVPTIEVIIQQIFGCKTTPLVCGVPVLFRLLSPARRPLQITADLQGFWRTTWADICKEMKGRYPKHNWDASKAVDTP